MNRLFGAPATAAAAATSSSASSFAASSSSFSPAFVSAPVAEVELAPRYYFSLNELRPEQKPNVPGSSLSFFSFSF